MKILRLIALLFIAGSNVFAQFPCFMLHQTGINQIEPVIVRHPSNQQILFASAFTIFPSYKNEGVYVSTNGGLNWVGADEVVGVPVQQHGGDPGPIIDKDGRFILTHQSTIPVGMYSNYSTNMGSSWSSNTQIASGDQDKGTPQTDDVPSSPYYGRTYLSWTRFANPFPIVISHTTNGGVSWTPFTQVNNSLPGKSSQGAAPSIYLNGEVCLTWASVTNTSPFTEDAMGFAKSTNGGASWSVQESAFDCNGIKTSQLSPWTIRANSFPSIDIDKTGGARNGWIYIVTTDKNLAPAGTDPDVVLHRSTDAGNTWSPGVRVNQDPINNGRNQFFPAMRVDENGGVNIVYYDCRNVADSVDIYLSRSVDGGFTWTDYRVTDRRFRPRGVVGTGAGIMGDNIGITSGNGKLYPVWMSDVPDNIFHAWCSIIDYTTIGINQIGSEIPKEFELKQNYPNPFNPVTKIRFQIPLWRGVDGALGAGRGVSLIIYDALGKTITELVNQELKPGSYEVQWNASSNASGVYFYSLTSGNYTQTRKMLLIK